MSHSHRHIRRYRRMFGHDFEMSNWDIFWAVVGVIAIICVGIYCFQIFTNILEYLAAES